MMLIGGMIFFLANRDAIPQNPYGDEIPRVKEASTKSRDVLFILRFYENEKSYVEDLVSRLAPMGTLAGDDLRELALGLVRISGDTSHAFVGVGEALPSSVVTNANRPGVVIAFRCQTARHIDTLNDDSDASAVTNSLRDLTGMRDEELMSAVCSIVEESSDGSVRLQEVRKQTLPGHQMCDYCGASFPESDTTCGNCGANASA